MISGKKKIDEDDVHTSRPSTDIENTSIAIGSMLHDDDRQMMVRKMEVAPGKPKTMIHHILTEYLMKKNIVVWCISHILFSTQKHCCMELCQKHLTCYKKE